MIYLIKSHLIPLQRKYSNYNITVLESPQQIRYNPLPADFVLCLIDDFVGSGETAISAAQYYIDNGVKTDQVAILSLVAMRQGIDCLEQHSYQVYTHIVKERAISDRTDGNREEYSKIMQTIEDQINVRDECRFGYAHSEALIKMTRTPNNTFPIYWMKNKKNPHPPFPR